jgi:hypothetical protein
MPTTHCQSLMLQLESKDHANADAASRITLLLAKPFKKSVLYAPVRGPVQSLQQAPSGHRCGTTTKAAASTRHAAAATTCARATQQPAPCQCHCRCAQRAAHTPAGLTTLGGCTRRVARDTFCAEYKSGGLRGVGGFSRSQLQGLVIQSSVLRPMKLREGPKSASGSSAFNLPLQVSSGSRQ